ncbi:MAG: alanine dehydrogenase, partial [bacterium]
MLVGVPKEIKNNEFRVAIVPAGVRQLTKAGHKVLITKGAGEGSGVSDEAYTSVGAKIVASNEEVFKKADMVIKVKEPLKEEYKMIRPGQILFTYFHFASSEELTQAMVDS